MSTSSRTCSPANAMLSGGARQFHPFTDHGDRAPRPPEEILKRELDTGVPVVYRLGADRGPEVGGGAELGRCAASSPQALPHPFLEVVAALLVAERGREPRRCSCRPRSGAS